MAQSTVFSQLIKLIPRTEFEPLVAKYDGDARVRSLDCWTWFGSLLFGQMTGHDSIRAIERVFPQQDGESIKLGFGPVRRSRLADANWTRPTAILEDLYAYCLARATAVAPKKSGFRFHGQVLALESTTIELCLALSPWAVFRKAKGAVKLHTAIDIAGNLAQFVILECHEHDRTRGLRA